MQTSQSQAIDNILISMLNDYTFCPRRFALHHVEGTWVDNEHTLIGTLLHDKTDTPGYETDGDVTLLRALPLFSKKHGLVGKADIVEMRNGSPTPVEYKKGRKKQWGNDDIQLCAQGLCLEEMFNTAVTVGYIYHAASKRRREVLLDDKLRSETLQTIEAVRQLLEKKKIPPAVLAPRCDGCSLRKICMPELTQAGSQKNLREYHNSICYDVHGGQNR